MSFTFKSVNNLSNSLKLSFKLLATAFLIVDADNPCAKDTAWSKVIVSFSFAFSCAISIKASWIVPGINNPVLVKLNALPSRLSLKSLRFPGTPPLSSRATDSLLILSNSALIVSTNAFIIWGVNSTLPLALIVTAFIIGRDTKSPVLAASITLKKTGAVAISCWPNPTTVSTLPLLLLKFAV